MAFQVLAARQIGIGEAYLILAERRTGSGYPIVESFLIVPKAQNCYRSRIENSRVTAIDLRVLEKLADVLAVGPGFLLSRKPATGGRRGREESPARRSRKPRE